MNNKGLGLVEILLIGILVVMMGNLLFKLFPVLVGYVR